MVFRGLEIKHKGIYSIKLNDNGYAIYQQRGNGLTDYYYRIYLVPWSGCEAYKIKKMGTITLFERHIIGIHPANNNEIALLRSFVERMGGSL